MPNAICEKCEKSLDDICLKEKHYNRLIKMLKERVKKLFGVPYNITPGIRHNEIISKNSWNCLSEMCDGVLYYRPLAKSPKRWKFDLGLLD
jgi:hypothetical protein|tara:strand:- start:3137 stop:3409 length:273 start_codon:yes stop_codon:yes gene_type:complete